MNLATAFADIAARNEARPALFWGEDEIPYGRLLAQTRAIAHHLRRDYGIQPGQRVGLWLRNCPEFVPALFGALAVGAAVVPINNFLKPDEVNYILADAGIDVLLTEESMNPACPSLLAARPSLKLWRIEDFPFATPAAAPLSSATDDRLGLGGPGPTETDLALIIYTSGTTGHPKGAMLTHGNLLHNVASCREVLKAVRGDRFVAVLPMFHSFTLTVSILLPLLVGGSVLVMKSVQNPKSVLDEIRRRQATILATVPPFFRALMNAQDAKDFPLRLCISGGAPLPLDLLQTFNARMPVPLIEGYGLSEASPVVSLPPLAGPWKEGSIGVPVPGVEMSVQDETGLMLEAGQTGEICVRGGNVMRGYWNQPEETARAMRRGWLLTGDVGHRDADGYYYITDRKKDMLLVNGINVYPREIEEVLYQLPAVREAAVIGVPDARKGEQPVAFVAFQEGQAVEEKVMLQHVKSKLADYKIPKRVLVLASLPHNATGKILKTALRKMV